MEAQDYMVNKIYSFVVIIALLLSGCQQKVVEKHYASQDYTTTASAFIVHEGIVNPSKGGGGEEVVVKYKRSECPECKGKGVIVQGDGHSATCPHCEPDKKEEPPLVKEVTIVAQCCDHCICGDSCSCVYPGQCLIKKNNGWPVKICDGNKCAVYYPQDANGDTYDPFQFFSPQDKIRYNKYKSPVPVDTKGDVITEKTFSQNCATCPTYSRRGR